MIDKTLLENLKKITSEEQKILDGESVDRDIYMGCDNIINSKKMLSKGKQIALRPHVRFVDFPEHAHDFVEIVYVCSGSTTHIVNGNKIHLKQGELLLLCQGAKQKILAAGYDDIAVNFIILPEFFDDTLKMLGKEDTLLKKFVTDCLKNNGSGTGYLHFQVADVLSVQNLIENLIYSLSDNNADDGSINSITMGLIFLHLINCTEKLVSADADERLMVRVLRFIEKNYKEGSLTDLSQELHYDISTLSRIIKKETGKNYTDLVREKRLSQACFFIETTDMNIDEIAALVGYENVSFFYRVFKKTFGISPKKYRKK